MLHHLVPITFLNYQILATAQVVQAHSGEYSSRVVSYFVYFVYIFCLTHFYVGRIVNHSIKIRLKLYQKFYLYH